MSGFELFDGDTKMRILYGSRTVLTTDGVMVNLLPPGYDINASFNIVFPDINKDYYYSWRHLFDYTALGNSVAYDSSCSTWLTALPQEFADETNIVAAPPGADIFIGKIKLNRTAAPSHTWNGQDLTPLQPMNVEIPFVSGSLLMECSIGLTRAFSVYVSGGFLKLHRQHSVSTAPGGWGMFGGSFNYLSPADGGGGENVFGSTAGIPVVQFDLVNVPSAVRTADLFSDPYDARTRRGGPNQCAIPNPSSYNFSSTYQAILTGSFGRRS